jgi:hypothetical protein
MRVRHHLLRDRVSVAVQIMEVKEALDDHGRVRIRYASGRHMRLPVSHFRNGSLVVLASGKVRMGQRFVPRKSDGRLTQSSHHRDLVFSGAKSDSI